MVRQQNCAPLLLFLYFIGSCNCLTHLQCIVTPHSAHPHSHPLLLPPFSFIYPLLPLILTLILTYYSHFYWFILFPYLFPPAILIDSFSSTPFLTLILTLILTLFPHISIDFSSSSPYPHPFYSYVNWFIFFLQPSLPPEPFCFP